MSGGQVFTVTPESKADSFGRVHFTARWHDGHRDRGQVFHTTPEQFTANAALHGFSVVGFEAES